MLKMSKMSILFEKRDFRIGKFRGLPPCRCALAIVRGGLGVLFEGFVETSCAALHPRTVQFFKIVSDRLRGWVASSSIAPESLDCFFRGLARSEQCPRHHWLTNKRKTENGFALPASHRVVVAQRHLVTRPKSEIAWTRTCLTRPVSCFILDRSKSADVRRGDFVR